MLREKDEAVYRADELLDIVERIAAGLAAQDYGALRRSLTLQRELARVFRGLVDCFWRYLIWERTLSEVEREWQRDDLVVALANWKDVVVQARPVIDQNYDAGLFEALGTRTEVWQDAWRPEGYYLEHLDQIHRDIVARIDVEPASVWGYYPRP
jgi:hypothetical protein